MSRIVLIQRIFLRGTASAMLASGRTESSRSSPFSVFHPQNPQDPLNLFLRLFLLGPAAARASPPSRSAPCRALERPVLPRPPDRERHADQVRLDVHAPRALDVDEEDPSVGA